MHYVLAMWSVLPRARARSVDACTAGGVGVRALSHLEVRQQAERRQHGGHHGRCSALFTGALSRDP